MRILFKTFVKTYYRQNAGQLAFLFFIMVLAVGRANYVGLLEYHYSLIRGILTSTAFLLPVLAAWLIYSWKCARFIAFTLHRPESSFLYLLADVKGVYWRLLQVQGMLYLPVWLYVLIMAAVGFRQGWDGPTAIVLGFNGIICLLSAAWYLYLVRHPGYVPLFSRWRPSAWGQRYYSNFLVRYLLTTRGKLLLAVKLYSCGILYLMVTNGVADDDWRLILLFYSLGILGHGILIHRLKELEETRLFFYRGLPVSLAGRFAQYARFCGLLFLPEMITIVALTPKYLYYSDMALFIVLGYSLLLLLNSLLLFPFPRMINYLKVIGGIFFLIYLGVLAGIVFWLSIGFFAAAGIIFFTRYYRIDQTVQDS